MFRVPALTLDDVLIPAEATCREDNRLGIDEDEAVGALCVNSRDSTGFIENELLGSGVITDVHAELFDALGHLRYIPLATRSVFEPVESLQDAVGVVGVDNPLVLDALLEAPFEIIRRVLAERYPLASVRAVLEHFHLL